MFEFEETFVSASLGEHIIVARAYNSRTPAEPPQNLTTILHTRSSPFIEVCR
jgi:hypothetical protein